MRQQHNTAKVDSLPFEVLYFDKEDVCKACVIRATLALAVTPLLSKNMCPYDVLIAGQAVARNLILVSHNVKEFVKIFACVKILIIKSII